MYNNRHVVYFSVEGYNYFEPISKKIVLSLILTGSGFVNTCLPCMKFYRMCYLLYFLLGINDFYYNRSIIYNTFVFI